MKEYVVTRIAELSSKLAFYEKLEQNMFAKKLTERTKIRIEELELVLKNS